MVGKGAQASVMHFYAKLVTFNPIGPDVYFEHLRPGGGGPFCPAQWVSRLFKEEVFSTEIASSPVKLTARVQFSDDARILKDFFLITQSLWQNFWKIKISKKNYNKIFFYFGRQCKYLKLEKPSSIDFKTPIQKRLENNIPEGWAKRTPPRVW